MTDSNGTVVMDQDYMPFGGDLPEIGQTEVLDKEAEGYKYTGQKEVVSIGLYYYGARYYDPSIGRFITEDSWPGEMGNPQSQNLYIYVINNPLRYVDPTGNYAVDGEKITIEKGDKLEQIAYELYGDINASINLALLNELESINTLIEGQILWAPEAIISQDISFVRIDDSYKGNTREVPDAFIAATIVGTVALEAGGLEVLSTAASSAYATIDKVFEKGYYWASDKLGKFRNFVSNKIDKVVNKDTKKSVFWSGGDAAKKAAQEWALNNRGKTLEMTKQGIRLEKQTKNMLWKNAEPLWDEASRNFARNASGEVHVFHNSSGIRLKSVWARIEYNELINNTNIKDIIYHLVDPN